MAWTYDEALTQPRDQVRFLIRDTNPGRPLLTDAEVAFLLAQEHDNVWWAAALGLDLAILAFSRYSSRSAGDVSVSYLTSSDISSLADYYRSRGGSQYGHQFPTAGGISRADIEVLRSNPDWPGFDMPVGLMDNPAAGSYRVGRAAGGAGGPTVLSGPV
jgi:hypothetical protein